MPRKFLEGDWVRVAGPVMAYTDDGTEYDLPAGTEGMVIIAHEEYGPRDQQIVEFPVDYVLDDDGEFLEWPDYAEASLHDDELELVSRAPPLPDDDSTPPSAAG